MQAPPTSTPATHRTARTPARRRAAGFTLVELMVVVVILGTLIALVGPNIWNMLFKGNVSAAETQMSNFESAIDQYRMSNKKLPDSLDALTETDGRNPYPFMKTIPKDPWGNEYEYRVLDRSTFQLRSYGEDGEPDTDDDITWPKTDE
ncbi:MAG: type II secretion system major pseudopilin GspG [Planctomycetota bacterium]|nr:type II secretion system major pseudopilin GspG [Planctomycetota bacterium]